MNQSMISAATSMNGIQRKLDIVADNMANLNTNGYKRKSATFADVLTNVRQHDKDYRQPGRVTPMGYTLGYGARLTAMGRDFSQGSLKQTGVSTDFALEGNALFEIGLTNGQSAWIREGAFHYTIDPASNEKVLVTAQGDKVLDKDGAEIRIAPDQEIQVNDKGQVFVTKNGIVAIPNPIATLKVVKPISPELLTQTENNYYVMAPNMNRNAVVEDLDLTENQTVHVRQGMIEQSNVSLIDEMNDLIQAQRAYQMSARALTSGDAMWGLANNLRA
ncbi:flagellar hook-basal body protein [Paenibacillus alvei]|uniref:Flagellar hook-basal body protein n=1 Tax=Paenibacillus alvei TaxID=44250 RepID=A0ABT4GS99_PAEAL|nr:flagellar hook-basal body protein [Paenibacillus alvei]MCY9759540.1 flagellar hook-basal body protein [Paenibacillus alvei]MCY9766336.1 flagellar hook-basal body protein [Paenibacillus alvei]